MKKFPTIIFFIIILFWIIFILIIITENFALGTHQCYTNITSIKSHFDIANLTTVTNMTHKGFCQSA